MFSLGKVRLKDVKKMCGVSDKEVSIIRNSAEPYKIGAYAYTRGDKIYVAPGCDETIPHEISHYKQQKQSGHQNTTDIINGQAVNDDIKLEASAERCKPIIPKVMLNNIVDSDADMGQNKNIPAQRVKINLNVDNDPFVYTSYKYKPIKESEAIKTNTALKSNENEIFHSYEKTFQFKGFINKDTNYSYKKDGQIIKKCRAYDRDEIEGISGKKETIDEDEGFRRYFSWGKYLLNVALPKTKLKRDENIVFMGHGNCYNKGDKFASYMEGYDAGMLAKLAAKVKKPWLWRGKIILFGCSTSNLAERVSKKYTAMTGKSVVVIGSNAPIHLSTHNGESYAMSLAECQEAGRDIYSNDYAPPGIRKHSFRDRINVKKSYKLYMGIDRARSNFINAMQYFNESEDYLDYFNIGDYYIKDREIKDKYLPYSVASIDKLCDIREQMKKFKYDEELISMLSSLLSEQVFINNTINNYDRIRALAEINKENSIIKCKKKYDILDNSINKLCMIKLDITDKRQFSAYQYNKWDRKVEKNQTIPWYKRIFGRRPTV